MFTLDIISFRPRHRNAFGCNRGNARFSFKRNDETIEVRSSGNNFFLLILLRREAAPAQLAVFAERLKNGEALAIIKP